MQYAGSIQAQMDRSTPARHLFGESEVQGGPMKRISVEQFGSSGTYNCGGCQDLKYNIRKKGKSTMTLKGKFAFIRYASGFKDASHLV